MYIIYLIYIVLIIMPSIFIYRRNKNNHFSMFPIVAVIIFFIIALYLQTKTSYPGSSLLGALFQGQLLSYITLAFDMISQLLKYNNNAAASLLINILLFWSYFIVSSIFYFLYKHFINEEEFKKLRWFKSHSASRYWLVVLFSYSILIGLIIPYLLMFEPPRFFLPNGTPDSLYKLIWIAPFIVVLEIYSAIHPPTPPSRSTAYQISQISQIPNAFLEELYNKYKANYTSLEKFHSQSNATSNNAYLPAQQARFQGNIERLINSFKEKYSTTDLNQTKIGISFEELGDKLDHFLDDPNILYMDGNTTDAHYRIFAELLQHCQEQGGVSLVIAPKAALPIIENNLSEAMAIHGVKLIERSHVLNNRYPNNQNIIFSTLFSPNGDLHDNLLKNVSDYKRELERLKLIICIDYHQLDIPILHLSLERLKRHIKISSLSMVVQSEKRKAGSTVLENFLKTTSKNNIIKIRTDAYAQKYYLQYLKKNNNSQSFFNGVLLDQTETTPNVAITFPALSWAQSKEEDISIICYDPDSRWIEKAAWNYQTPYPECKIHLPTTDEIVIEHPSTFSGFPVVFQEDTHNIMDILDRNLNYSAKNEYMTVILSNNYPMRDYLIDNLQEIMLPNVDTLPLSPDPRPGIAELAIILAEELVANPKTSQEEVERYFKEFLPTPELAKLLNISPSKEGIETLFHEIFGETVGQNIVIQVTTNKYHERQYSIESGELPDMSSLFFYKTKFGDRSYDKIFKSDLGLNYALDTQLIFEGKIYNIISIADQEINLAQSDTIDHKILDFSQKYSLDFSRKAGVRPDPIIHHNIDFYKGFFYADFKRTTTGVYEYKEGSAPFSTDQTFAPPFKAFNTPIEKKFKLRGIYVLQFSLKQEHIDQLDISGTDYDLARLVFTLAATLQDVLFSLFPKYAHRISVLSPHASTYAKDIIKNRDQLHQFIARRYPQFTDEDNIFSDPFDFDLNHNEDEDEGVETKKINLFIIEDSGYDIGVVHSFDKNLSYVLGIWYDYIKWLELNQNKDDFYYRFGTDQIADCFSFESAKNFIDMISKIRI